MAGGFLFATSNLVPAALQQWAANSQKKRPGRHGRELKERLEYMHLNPVQKGLVERPEDWRWSSYNNFALDKATVTACPIQIDYVRPPERYRA